MMNNDPSRYDDIINLEHPVSKRHARMSAHDRAAQFAPFAALTGYDAMVAETSRLTDCQAELDDAQRMLLNDALAYIMDNLAERPQVTIEYFEPDSRKAGGQYRTISDRVRNVNAAAREIVLKGGRTISFDLVRTISFPEEE